MFVVHVNLNISYEIYFYGGFLIVLQFLMLKYYCFNLFTNEVLVLAGKIDVTPTMPRISKVQKNRMNNPASSPEEYYRVNVAIPFLDELIQDMEYRYSSQNQRLLSLFLVTPQCFVESTKDSTEWFKSVSDSVSCYDEVTESPDFMTFKVSCFE